MIYNTFEEFARYYMTMKGNENKSFKEVNRAYNIYKQNLKKHFGMLDISKQSEKSKNTQK